MAIVCDLAHPCAVRAIAICAVLVGYGCGQSELAPSARMPGAAPAAAAERIAPAPPGLRLPDGVAPVEYDLTLDLDPARDSFTGRVAIAIAVSQPTAQIWLHAVDLAIARAQLVTARGAEPVAQLTGGEPWQMRGFALPRTVAAAGPETITLAIDYTGNARDLSQPGAEDEEGLFRQRAGDRWYLYSQSESIFARKIVPCFDEPRWKPSWRVTVTVPRDLVALGNAPIAAERALPGGRREVRFAALAGLPSYLLAVAVGPFDLVDLGRLGREHIPVRLATIGGDPARLGRARRAIPKIIDWLESYFDAPLPAAKLDLVEVPEFFGAMENVGLITIASHVLAGRAVVPVVAHELAHHWFGDLVTPAWWDHLWLSEAFASWMEDRVAESLGEARSPMLAYRGRARAVSADAEVDAEPLVHPIASSDDIEPAFNETAYRKGAALVGEFERFVGADRFQSAVRAYMAAQGGHSVTSQAFVDALAAASSPEVGAALETNLAYAGTPVVDLELRCGAPATIVASVRGGVGVPVCVRFPVSAQASDRACFLADSHTAWPLPEKARCPAWIIGNAGGRGYYDTVWHGPGPQAPLAVQLPEERLARGDDAAAAVRRGELSIGAALSELAALAATHDAHDELAALTIARAIDPMVSDPVRPAWAAWLAARFSSRLTPSALSTPKSQVGEVLRTQIIGLARPAVDARLIAAARSAIEHTPLGLGAGGVGVFEGPVLQLAAGRDADPLFARIVHAATVAPDDVRDEVLEGLGEFPPAFAPRIAGLALDGRFPAAQVWPALGRMLRRGETRTAAWRAIHARLPQLLRALTVARADEVIAAAASLCDAAARDEVARGFTPVLAAIRAGQRALAHALASIDRCIAGRAALGDIAAALAGAPRPVSTDRRLTTPR